MRTLGAGLFGREKWKMGIRVDQEWKGKRGWMDVVVGGAELDALGVGM